MTYAEIMDTIQNCADGYLKYSTIDYTLIYENLIRNTPTIFDMYGDIAYQTIEAEVELFYNN